MSVPYVTHPSIAKGIEVDIRAFEEGYGCSKHLLQHLLQMLPSLRVEHYATIFRDKHDTGYLQSHLVWLRVSPVALGGVSRVLLRLRLQATGDRATQPTDDPTRFDDALEAAVRRFQRRHGLVADGRVGPDTRTALQIPIEDRLRQLTRNLDRWRWLPHDLGVRYILINIPAFTLNVVEHNRSVLTGCH